MFCIIPVDGMPLRLSWQLVSIWVACAATCVILSSWWWRLFLLLALFRTATRIPPAYDEYVSLLTLSVFLVCAEGFSRIDREKTMDFMCVAALAFLDWISLQILGIAPPCFVTGLLNPDTAAVFLALCLSGCFRKWRFSFDSAFSYRTINLAPWRREWRLLIIPLIFGGLVLARSTTGWFAATAVLTVAAWYFLKDWRKMAVAILAVVMLAGFWFWQVKPIESMTNNIRWQVWKHAAWSLRSEAFGRGLGTWEWIFPLLVSGDKRMQTEGIIAQAHNENVHMTFELGLQALALLLIFQAVVLVTIYRKKASTIESMGMAALMVSCFGFFCMHVPPTALLGCAWLGMWHRNRQKRGTFERTGVLSSVEACQGGDRRSWAI